MITMDSLVKSEIVSWVLDIFVTILLVMVTILSSYTTSWQYTVSISVLGLLLLIFLRTRPLTKQYLSLRNAVIRSQKSTKVHHVMNEYHNEEINRLIDTMHNLSKGRYEARIDDVPNSSINCINNLKKSGFVVYVTDSKTDYYKTSQGQRYLKACYEAGRSASISFTRLFVISSVENLTQELFELMEEHINNQVKVLVAEKNELEDLPHEVVLDFGLFDGLILMKFSKGEKESARLEVHFDDAETARYRDFIARLSALRTYEQFISDLYKPLNSQFWAGLLAKSRRLDVPYGLSEKDSNLIVGEAMGASAPSKNPAILVLGLTPLLIDCLQRANAEVWCIDQANIQPKEIDEGKHFVGNWLDCTIDKEFDAIVSDEGINNLSMIQYRPFFQNLHRHLKHDGRLIMRVMCRVPGWENHAKYNSAMAIDVIKKTTESTNDKTVAASILSILHSPEFGFSEKSSMISPEIWNKKTKEWFSQGLITMKQQMMWTFPYILRLSSPSLNSLSEIPRDLFVVREVTNVDIEYCPVEGELEPFYRIVSWKRL